MENHTNSNLNNQKTKTKFNFMLLPVGIFVVVVSAFIMSEIQNDPAPQESEGGKAGDGESYRFWLDSTLKKGDLEKMIEAEVEKQLKEKFDQRIAKLEKKYEDKIKRLVADKDDEDPDKNEPPNPNKDTKQDLEELVALRIDYDICKETEAYKHRILLDEIAGRKTEMTTGVKGAGRESTRIKNWYENQRHHCKLLEEKLEQQSKNIQKPIEGMDAVTEKIIENMIEKSKLFREKDFDPTTAQEQWIQLSTFLVKEDISKELVEKIRKELTSQSKRQCDHIKNRLRNKKIKDRIGLIGEIDSVLGLPQFQLINEECAKNLIWARLALQKELNGTDD